MKHIILLLENICYDGGVERVVCNMANSFVKYKNYKVIIMSIFKHRGVPKYDLNNQVVVDSLNIDDSPQSYKKHLYIQSSLFMRLKLNKEIADRLYKKIERFSDCCILCNSYVYSPSYRRKNVKLIGVDHSRFPFGNTHYCNILYYLRTLNVRKMDIITTLNYNELAKWKSFGKPTYVMPNFIPQNMVPVSEQYGRREKIILSMGRMNTEQKGFDRLINAYSLIAKCYPEWKLKIFGSGCYQNKYKQMVKDRQLESFITISDFTSYPINEYQKASIYAMCSREEGFAMVLLEAGIYGLPLVAYDVEFGPNVIIKNGITGYVIPDNNPSEFAKALESLMNDDTLRKEMSQAVSQDIKKRYSEKVIMDKWIQIIDHM